MKDLTSTQAYMQQNQIDAWLLFDFRGSNDVLWQLVGRTVFTTRRVMLLVPQDGPVRALVHAIDELGFDGLLPEDTTLYRSRFDIDEWLQQNISDSMTLAMEYSPLGALPTLSKVDGGTIEKLRGLGATITSSADLFQCALAVWDDAALQSHRFAVGQVVDTLRVALDYVADGARASRPITELGVQQLILSEFSARGLETDEVPVVAVNQNSGNPHYMPSEQRSSPIQRGDWLLIDLWARRPGNENIFADITWVAYVGAMAPLKQQHVFEVVAAARDAVVERLQSAWHANEQLAGWQLDQVARDSISDAGYGDQFIHRTGHSIGPGEHLHALGVNLDNFETQDLRAIIPGVGFSIEPGVYLSEFGVRSEIDVYVDPELGPSVTTPLQTSIDNLLE